MYICSSFLRWCLRVLVCVRARGYMPRVQRLPGHTPVSGLFQMYITSTIKTKSSRLAKPVLCLGTLCTAFLTGLNRVSEYRNHCSDVIAGFILGTAVALFLVGQPPSSCFVPLVPSERPPGIPASQVSQAPQSLSKFLWPHLCELQSFFQSHVPFPSQTRLPIPSAVRDRVAPLPAILGLGLGLGRLVPSAHSS